MLMKKQQSLFNVMSLPPETINEEEAMKFMGHRKTLQFQKTNLEKHKRASIIDVYDLD